MTPDRRSMSRDELVAYFDCGGDISDLHRAHLARYKSTVFAIRSEGASPRGWVHMRGGCPRGMPFGTYQAAVSPTSLDAGVTGRIGQV